MKVEKWIYHGKEVNVPVFEDDEIEENDDIEIENTLDLTNVLGDNKDE